MFNRRFLRIKVFQELYACSRDENANIQLHEKNLLKGIDKAYELYIFLLSLPAAFRTFVHHELEIQQAKFYPSEKIILPLKAIYKNKAIIRLEESEYVNEKVKSYNSKWLSTNELFKKMWNQLKDHPFFVSYSEKAERTFMEDRKAANEMMQIFIGDSELFNDYMEEFFINWEDDQTLAVGMLLKSIDRIRENGKDEFVTRPYDDKEDLAFMRDLFHHCLDKDEELTGMIAGKTENWEPERIAMADMLLMKMALCEILYFPYVPVKVSINEYLELAKLYSTPNSHGFINGILDKVQLNLKELNKIVKQGRGLVE